jgi:hypothetical protein
MREKSRLRDGVESGLGSGVHVQEVVSVVVEEDLDDYVEAPARSMNRPRLVPSMSTFSKKERELREEEDLEAGSAVPYEDSVSSEERR